MGMQDRDYYREWWNNREGPPKKRRRIFFRRRTRGFGPPLIGENWHWSLKLLVWLCIAVLLLAAIRLVR